MGNKLVSIFFISFLNPLKESYSQITGGIDSQILGPKYDTDSLQLVNTMSRWDGKVRCIT